MRAWHAQVHLDSTGESKWGSCMHAPCGARRARARASGPNPTGARPSRRAKPEGDGEGGSRAKGVAGAVGFTLLVGILSSRLKLSTGVRYG